MGVWVLWVWGCVGLGVSCGFGCQLWVWVSVSGDVCVGNVGVDVWVWV